MSEPCPKHEEYDEGYCPECTIKSQAAEIVRLTRQEAHWEGEYHRKVDEYAELKAAIGALERFNAEDIVTGWVYRADELDALTGEQE